MDYRATIQLIVLLLFPLLGRAQFGMDMGDVALLGGSPTTGESWTYYSAYFDGSNDYLTKATDVFPSDGQSGTVSFWFKMDPSSSDSTLYQIAGNSNQRWQVLRLNTARIDFQMKNSSGTIVMRLYSAATMTNGSGWHHVMACWDLGTAGRRYLYIDGSLDTSGITFTEGETIDMNTGGAFAVGAISNGNSKFYGYLCELWVDDAWLDLSDADNRAKFYDAGSPVDLGADGSTPTGGQPLIYLRNAVPDWEVNLGSGGGFTENGSLTDGGAEKP